MRLRKLPRPKSKEVPWLGRRDSRNPLSAVFFTLLLSARASEKSWLLLSEPLRLPGADP